MQSPPASILHTGDPVLSHEPLVLFLCRDHRRRFADEQVAIPPSIHCRRRIPHRFLQSPRLYSRVKSPRAADHLHSMSMLSTGLSPENVAAPKIPFTRIFPFKFNNLQEIACTRSMLYWARHESSSSTPASPSPRDFPNEPNFHNPTTSRWEC